MIWLVGCLKLATWLVEIFKWPEAFKRILKYIQNGTRRRSQYSWRNSANYHPYGGAFSQIMSHRWRTEYIRGNVTLGLWLNCIYFAYTTLVCHKSYTWISKLVVLKWLWRRASGVRSIECFFISSRFSDGSQFAFDKTAKIEALCAIWAITCPMTWCLTHSFVTMKV